MVKSIWLEIFRLWSDVFLLAEGDKVTRHSSLFVFCTLYTPYYYISLLLWRYYDKYNMYIINIYDE